MEEKNKYISEKGIDLSDDITIDSPIPYNIYNVLSFLDIKNTERVKGDGGREKMVTLMENYQGLFNDLVPKFLISDLTSCFQVMNHC